MRTSKIFCLKLILLALTATLLNGYEHKPQSSQSTPGLWDPFLDSLQVRTLRYFLETTDSATGLAYDRWPSPSPSSIAAVGFALTSYPLAAERQLITRREAARRVRNTLQFFWQLPQSEQAQGIGGYKGFFYHFLKIPQGTREWNCELSTMDTALLLAGALFCQSYFDGSNAEEQTVRALADSLYRRVDWKWAMDNRDGVTMGWTPEKGFHDMIWEGFNEAMIVYILALGSPTHPVPESAWQAWTASYKWRKDCRQEFVSFGPLFGHHYSHCWIDFRGIQDHYMRQKGIDYFENTRRATYAQREYARRNPNGYRDYSENIWGFTACDGPGNSSFVVDGRRRKFKGYSARSVCHEWLDEDGTLAPTAPGGSLPFAPEICIPALKTMKEKYGEQLWTKYGFLDAFNPTFITAKTPNGWFDRDYLGIDQGPIVIMSENLRSGLVWEVMKKNPYVVAGLKRAGFSGGWLNADSK